ncbi:MAG: ribosome rescue protein RqcH [Candidatus Bathyarchaeota archaeon]
MKGQMTSFDIFALTNELDNELCGYYIDNVYQVNPFTLILKLNKPGQQPKQLVVESGKRVNLTKYEVKKPKEASGFSKALRKYLNNNTVQKIDQKNFERIIVINTSRANEAYQLIVELFDKGNIILASSDGTIIQALSYRKMTYRNILRGEKFIYPQPIGFNPRTVTFRDFLRLKEYDDDVVRALTRFLAIGGTYAEEFLSVANIEKTVNCRELTEGQIESLYKAVAEAIDKLRSPKPGIVLENSEKPLDIIPFPMSVYSKKQWISYPTINEALDDYFTKISFEKKDSGLRGKFLRRIEEQKRILNEQTAKLRNFEDEITKDKRIGDLIHRNVSDLQNLFTVINNRRQIGKPWHEIKREISLEHEEKASFQYFEDIDAKKQCVEVKVENLKFSLELKRSVYENASIYYDKSKELKKKTYQLKQITEETQKKIESLREEESVSEAKSEKPERVREKKWYEKYNFFISSEKFIVVAGKDASSNEALIKRYTEPNDIVIHAEITGSPFVVIKTQGQTPSETTIFEAAQFAAAHSRAWREGLGSVKLYSIKPEQLSKKAPTGQYISRGAFIVNGKRNYLPNISLRLAVGIIINEEIEIKTGPPSVIRSITDKYVEISPGDDFGKLLAFKIKKILSQKVREEQVGKVLKIPVEKIVKLIPFGRAHVISKTI